MAATASACLPCACQISPASWRSAASVTGTVPITLAASSTWPSASSVSPSSRMQSRSPGCSPRIFRNSSMADAEAPAVMSSLANCSASEICPPWSSSAVRRTRRACSTLPRSARRSAHAQARADGSASSAPSLGDIEQACRQGPQFGKTPSNRDYPTPLSRLRICPQQPTFTRESTKRSCERRVTIQQGVASGSSRHPGPWPPGRELDGVPRCRRRDRERASTV